MVATRRVVQAQVEPSTLSRNSTGRHLDPHALVEMGDRRVDFLLLEELKGKSVLGVDVFDAASVVALCKFAGLLEMTEIASHHPLDGKLVITAFFEASTRTRLSFESAALRLDAKVVSVPDGKVTGIAKGESLADIGEMFNSYGDLVVMRHPQDSSIDEVCKHLKLPLINAGNGTQEHPTQALVDWYTLLKWRPQLATDSVAAADRIHLGVIGDPRAMRTVRSFLRMATHFSHAISELSIIAPGDAPVDTDLLARLKDAGIKVNLSRQLAPVLPLLDVIYINSIALLEDGYHELASEYQLTLTSPFKPNAVIMHPFARRSELSRDLDATERNLYFAQAAGAVFIRQALLISLLGRISALPSGVLYLAK